MAPFPVLEARAPSVWTLASWHRGIPTSHVPLPHIACTSLVAPRSSPSSSDPPFRTRCTRGTGSLAPLAAVAVAVRAVGVAVYLPLLEVETEATPAPPSPDGQGSGSRSAHLRRWGIVGVAVRGGTRDSLCWNAQAQCSSNTRAAVPPAGVVAAVFCRSFPFFPKTKNIHSQYLWPDAWRRCCPGSDTKCDKQAVVVMADPEETLSPVK
ncbi:UNVERIFIED_CONTAM: hypothetical protein FKN15_014149 [Acipenser sinensis]